MILAATGHRPNKLGGYREGLTRKLEALASEFIVREQPTIIITGMALGWDLAVANAAWRHRIEFIAAVPFVGQERKWPTGVQRDYRFLLQRASKVEVISPGGYDPAKMHIRNQWMVDRAHAMVALWDGSDDGGTAACLKYARAKNVPVHNLWDDWLKIEARSRDAAPAI
jgi:uncharacterized phage-like protein YoqJ